jgi:C4-dicarboxylate-specific signal transduction histidine kinase
MIAAVLVPALWTVPGALVCAVALVWYFVRLGGDDVPSSRRRVRRLSIASVLVTLPLFVWVLSFIDPTRQPAAFIVLWSVIFVMALIIIALALLDVVNNLRLHHEMVKADLNDAAAELAEAIRRRREQEQSGTADESECTQREHD